MASKKSLLGKVFAFSLFAAFSMSANALIKYNSSGRLTIGTTTPYSFYPTTHNGSIYFKDNSSHFFQIDITPANPRLAGQGDQVVFYNTQTSTFNSIQVKNVYNYSDARAKTNIQPLANCMSGLKKLRTYSYKFKDEGTAAKAYTLRKGGHGKEYGLLAQEVEKVFPNLVVTDNEGKKLINYTELIPVLINAVQQLSSEVEELKGKISK